MNELCTHSSDGQEVLGEIRIDKDLINLPIGVSWSWGQLLLRESTIMIDIRHRLVRCSQEVKQC